MVPLLYLGIAAAGIYALTKIKQVQAAPDLTFTPLNPKLGKNGAGQSGIIVPISIFNPSTSTFTLTGVTGDVSANGNTLGALQFSDKLVITANGYTTMDLFVLPDYTGIFQGILSMFTEGLAIPSMLITGKVFIGSFTVPFSVQTKAIGALTTGSKQGNKVVTRNTELDYVQGAKDVLVINKNAGNVNTFTNAPAGNTNTNLPDPRTTPGSNEYTVNGKKIAL